MLFDIPFVADWKRIGDYRQSQTDRSNTCENKKQVDYDYKVGDKILIHKDNTPQSRVHLEKRTIDYIYSSHTWNYQDSMRNQIGKKLYPESNTI